MDAVYMDEHDAILPITDYNMQQIIYRQKTYDFRRFQVAPTVLRFWFYLTAPFSCIAYVCEVDPARSRTPHDRPLPEDGIGNLEWNTGHRSMDGYDFAYRIRSVWKLRAPLHLNELKKHHGLRTAPSRPVAVPLSIMDQVFWWEQSMLWSVDEEARRYLAANQAKARQVQSVLKRKRSSSNAGVSEAYPMGKRIRLQQFPMTVPMSGAF